MEKVTSFQVLDKDFFGYVLFSTGKGSFAVRLLQSEVLSMLDSYGKKHFHPLVKEGKRMFEFCNVESMDVYVVLEEPTGYIAEVCLDGDNLNLHRLEQILFALPLVDFNLYVPERYLRMSDVDTIPISQELNLNGVDFKKPKEFIDLSLNQLERNYYPGNNDIFLVYRLSFTNSNGLFMYNLPKEYAPPNTPFLCKEFEETPLLDDFLYVKNLPSLILDIFAYSNVDLLGVYLYDETFESNNGLIVLGADNPTFALRLRKEDKEDYFVVPSSVGMSLAMYMKKLYVSPPKVLKKKSPEVMYA
ncbi:MAG: hypothetical protein J7K22_02105 [Nanoarchaeota archaeon]|nr:hypothetical protein [Nanoarchaeota archaeon]